MTLDLSMVGQRTDPHPISWNSTQAILYALGVGAGTDEKIDELAFVTENTDGLPQLALPTFSVVLGSGAPRLGYGDIDHTKLVHAEQSVRLHRRLPVEGSGFISSGIDAMYDKGSGALIVGTAQLTDADGTAIADLGTGVFIRGEGGFGGERGPSASWTAPDRDPDVVVEQETLPWQALLYRLSGDRNPLHSDPAFAARGGFAKPILHGLCTYGFVGRALLHGAAGSDPAALHSMTARFSAPVLPGDRLRTSIWRDGDDVFFTTVTGAGTTVLSNGRASIGDPW